MQGINQHFCWEGRVGITQEVHGDHIQFEISRVIHTGAVNRQDKRIFLDLLCSMKRLCALILSQSFEPPDFLDVLGTLQVRPKFFLM